MSMTSTLPLQTTPAHDRAASIFAIITGICITLMIRGYRFGESNHAVYLIEAIRRIHPGTFDNDWWTRSTLQYHIVFNALTAFLMRAGILEPAFLVGYLALAGLLHLGWYRLVLELDGTVGTYVMSVVLFYLLAGGLGLGHYHFLQDSCFLPSNIANVAMLWGITFWIAGRWSAAGICLGIAGLFHINHAIVAIALWRVLALLEGFRKVEVRTPSPLTSTNSVESYSGERGGVRGFIPSRSQLLKCTSRLVGSLFVVLLSAIQIVPVLQTVLARSGKLPLNDFVDLFVRLRHPHHFDPRTWHWALWITFLLPIPFFIVDVMKVRSRSNRSTRAFEIFCFLSLLTLIALFGAGLFYFSETLVQLNLYRFSIYIKLLSCIGAARWINSCAGGSRRRKRLTVVFGCTAIIGIAITSLGWSRLGIRVAAVRSDPIAFIETADWARENTPADAIFIVPPELQSFRLRARRAIVVDYKNVPQLSGELPEWRSRLEAVLDLDNLMTLPRPMSATLDAIAAQYDRVPVDHHLRVASRYGAQYLITRHSIDSPSAQLVYAEGGYFLYHLQKP